MGVQAIYKGETRGQLKNGMVFEHIDIFCDLLNKPVIPRGMYEVWFEGQAWADYNHLWELLDEWFIVQEPLDFGVGSE